MVPGDREVRINCFPSGRAPGAQIPGSAKGSGIKKTRPYCGKLKRLLLGFKRANIFLVSKGTNGEDKGEPGRMSVVSWCRLIDFFQGGRVN